MKIQTYGNAFTNLISAVCISFVVFFTFLAVFQPEVLNEYVPQYADQIREYGNAVKLIVTNLYHKIF